MEFLKDSVECQLPTLQTHYTKSFFPEVSLTQRETYGEFTSRLITRLPRSLWIQHLACHSIDLFCFSMEWKKVHYHLVSTLVLNEPKAFILSFNSYAVVSHLELVIIPLQTKLQLKRWRLLNSLILGNIAKKSRKTFGKRWHWWSWAQ